MAEKPSDLVKVARARFQRCAEHEDKQRKRILLAKQFRAGDQWPDEIKIQRQGGASLQGQAAQPPRPCLTIDRLSQPVRQISNQIKSANFAIDVLPNGHGADKETAEILKGYIRRVQNNARGDSPVEWAADGAVEGGIGWFRLRTEYVHESVDGIDPSAPELFDQELRMERITNNLTVYCDPSAVRPTRSDALFMFVTEDLDKDEYKRRYKASDADMASLDDFEATGDDSTGWVTEKNIRIAEYWRIVYEDTEVTSPTGQVRKVQKPVVKMDKINALTSLESSDWVGPRIPLIPVLGEELNVDGQVVVRGVIEEGMDSQRMVNYMYSAAIETVALAPKAPIIAAEGQLEGYEALWQNANRCNYSYLPYKPTSLNGTPVPPPMRDQAEPAIQAMVLMLQKSEEAIKATTGIHDPGLGVETRAEKSGRAIQALQAQGELGSSNYSDNVARALIYAGEQMVEIIPKITRPGQLLQILGVDDQPEQVIVGQPFVEGDNGQPQPVNPDLMDTMKGMAKLYDLTRGKYAVTATVGKSYTTRLQEGAAALGELIPNLPPEMSAPIVPEYIEQLSFPGAHKIAERARRALPPHLRDPEDGKTPNIQELMAQNAQLQQQLQTVTQVAQQQFEQIQTDQIKAQAQFQQQQLKEQAENQREQMRLAVEMRKVEADLTQATRELEVKLEIEMAKLGSAQMMKRGELEAEQLHQHGERLLRQEELGAQQAQADMDRQNERDVKSAELGLKAREGDETRRLQRDEGAAGRAFEADQAERAREAEANQPTETR